ncbi:MAG: ComEC/Rec2 family competence protein, partial [bacterium]
MLGEGRDVKNNFFRLYSLHFSVLISFITGFLTGFQGAVVVIILTVMEKERKKIFFILIFFFLCGTYTSYRDFTFPETYNGTIKKVSDNSILLYRGWFYRVEETKSLEKNDIISWKREDVERKNRAYHLKNFEIKNPNSLRQRFIKFTERQKMGPLATALLTGERRFGSSFRRPFSRTGTSHIIALSALHIGTVLLFFFFITKVLRSFKFLSSIFITYISFLFSMAGAIFYLWITGWSIPTVRAAVFIMLISGFRKSGIFLHPQFVYIISLLLTLTLVPHSITQYSFIMSAVAVGTVIYSWKRSSNSVSIRIITTGIMVNTALIPILSSFNGYVTYAAPLANLILLPVMGITVALTFAVQLTFFLFPQILPPFMEILQFLCDALIVITKGLSQYSQGMLIPTVKPPNYVNILFYVFFFLSMTGKKSIKISAAAILVISIAFYLIPL